MTTLVLLLYFNLFKNDINQKFIYRQICSVFSTIQLKTFIFLSCIVIENFPGSSDSTSDDPTNDKSDDDDENFIEEVI